MDSRGRGTHPPRRQLGGAARLHSWWTGARGRQDVIKGPVEFGLGVLGVLAFALVLSHGCEPNGGDADPCAGQACSDGNACTSDVCTTGRCSNPAVANGTPCDADGEDGGCQDGLCLPVSPSLEEGLYAFLAQQQDPATGLLEGFVRHPDLPPDFLAFLGALPSFTYDNALAALAWLARGEPDDLDRATRVLDALLALQRGDGALPDSANAVTGAPLAASTGTGNQAWAILAFLGAWEVIGQERWLLAAERVAAFLLDPAQELANPAGFGGLRLAPGVTGVSTENNLDVYAAFVRLADALPTSAGRLTAAEVREAGHGARILCESQFDPVTGAMFAGTDGTGVTTFRGVVPLDTQSWSVLALGRSKWDRSYAWARREVPEGLWITEGACAGAGRELAIEGPPFSDAFTGDVWTEGLAQMRLAARALGDDDTDARAAAALEDLQRAAPNADGQGLVATCSEVETGFASSYFNALAVAPTAWAAMASRGLDPFWFRAIDDHAHPAASLPMVSLTPPADLQYACTGTQPCRFMATGTSTGVVGTAHRVYLLVEPTSPAPLGRFFTQAVPAVVAADGTWIAPGQLGDEVSGVEPGDGMRLVTLVVEGAAPPPQLEFVTQRTVPNLVTVSGVLDARVR